MNKLKSIISITYTFLFPTATRPLVWIPIKIFCTCLFLTEMKLLDVEMPLTFKCFSLIYPVWRQRRQKNLIRHIYVSVRPKRGSLIWNSRSWIFQTRPVPILMSRHFRRVWADLGGCWGSGRAGTGRETTGETAASEPAAAWCGESWAPGTTYTNMVSSGPSRTNYNYRNIHSHGPLILNP